MYTFAELLSEKTLEQWKRSIVATSALKGLKTENWAEGGYTRTLVALFSQLYKTGGDVVRTIAASVFLDTAEGGWLSLLAKSMFNVERIEANFAKAPNGLTLANGGGGLFVFDAGDLVASNASGTKTYRNTSGGTLSPGGELKLDLQAEEAGSGSSAAAGTILRLVTTFLGVTCTNAVALVGLDEETDPALRQRCRDSVALLSFGGIKRAYDFIARSARRADGSPVGVTRVRVMPAVGDGTVDVYIASASGAVAIDDVAIVQSEFDTKVTPEGFGATAISAAAVAITVPCTIWIPSALGLSEADARQAVRNALQTYVSALPVGGVIISPATGRVYWRALLARVSSAIAGTLKVELASEVDIAIADGQVPVWAGIPMDTTVVQVVADEE